jgi:antitoxin (DNA-binding transcriptional repressor) of toxin-antitoxin stability system
MFNKNNKKQIIFKDANLNAKYLLDIPKPAYNNIPQWFKGDRNFANGENDPLKTVKKGGSSHATYKLCVPVTDSISSGYNIVLPASVYVRNVGNQDIYDPRIEWQVDWGVCDVQPAETLQNYPIPHGHSPMFFRWQVDWQIITPHGYSSWVTHPSHRYDLPFTTLNGFIDTDKHPNPLYLPFFIKEGFEGIIDAGTPIAQIIPIKRDHWVSKKEEYDKEKINLTRNNVKLDFFRTYKNRYWSKKRYE